MVPLQTFNELMKPLINEAEILAMVSKSQEFDQVKVCVVCVCGVCVCVCVCV